MDEVQAERESEVFSTLDRIDRKLQGLQKVLQPITSPVPKTANDKVGGRTVLSGRLYSVEENLTSIIDSVNL